jgi:1-acyl-sn-glycerol-3-phosphate acyltransferase
LAAAPRRAGPRQLRRLAQLALQFVRGSWVVAVRFPRLDRAQKGLEFQRWARQVLAILEIEVQASAAAPQGFAGLVVCNHLSWLDVLVLQSLLPCAFVAKTEVRQWPLVGWLSHACATIFVDRSSARSAHAMVDDTAAAMRRGDAVVVFPEGTSSDGQSLGTFHANIFESAIRAGAPVQLLSLRYLQPDSGAAATAAHFTGNMTLAQSLKRITASPGIRARVQVGERLDAQGHSRKTLAQHAHARIRQQLLDTAHATS